MSASTGGRVFLGQVQLAGVTDPIWTEYDYTDPSVASAYYEQISIIKAIYAKQVTAGAPSATLSAADVANVNAALAALQTLAINGLSANSTANIVPPVVTMKQYFLTKQMATNLDLLFRSFESVGATGSPPVLTLDQLNQWKDLSAVSEVIGNIINSATYAAVSNRSLQSVVELEYVKTGSELIGDKLSTLNDALTITNSILTSLSNLQDVRNRMVVNAPAGYTLPTSGMINPDSDGAGGIHAADIMSAYRGNASLYFNAQIVPQVDPSLISGIALSPAGKDVFDELIAIQKSILSFIPKLSAVVGPDALADPNSLYGRIKNLAHNFSLMFTAAGVAAADVTTPEDQLKALQTFLLDNSVSAFKVTGTSPGDGQSALNFGITAGQALNDQQKESVRQFLNIFEEYYKSASSILQALSRMIEKMAQNISR